LLVIAGALAALPSMVIAPAHHGVAWPCSGSAWPLARRAVP
jgi:hypothetical protein